MKIAEFEQSKHWQATAQTKNGNQIAIMKSSDPQQFYLYDGLMRKCA
ncbi:MAG: hypothetical protein NVS1B11_18150 [Terriglobales bacterium]